MTDYIVQQTVIAAFMAWVYYPKVDQTSADTSRYKGKLECRCSFRGFCAVQV